MPSLCSESPTHLAVMAAAMSGTMYCKPPVNSNIMTTSDTMSTRQTSVRQTDRQTDNELARAETKWHNGRLHFLT